MPFGVRLEDAAPLKVFFTQARKGIGKEDALPVLLLLHYHVDKALGDFVGHFGNVYSLDILLASYRLHGSNAWYSSSRRPSREFLQCLDAYLNQKLVESGLSPVMSVYDSMECWSWLVLDRQ